MNFQTLDNLNDISGKRVLVRVDWNVPMANGVVQDDFRIQKSLPTLNLLQNRGAKVILMTHLDDEAASVEPLQAFVPEGMELLENLRRNSGEKTNDEQFAQELASKADIYVNEAFSVSHREHASIVGVPKFLPSYAGLEFAQEVERLSEVFHPDHPFLFILGGAKFETKLPLVTKFLDIADEIVIAGANAKQAHDQGFEKYQKISFPHGDIAALDADDETIMMCKAKIQNANFVVWNGPLGKYEDGYTQGTQNLARVLAESGKRVIVGGADTLAAIKALNLFEKFYFVSTGGGAMLDFLANGTLPGIEALKK